MNQDTDKMFILVDFDNLPRYLKREGLPNVCARIINAIAQRKKHFTIRTELRLYGGWYEDDNLTDEASRLIIDITGSFPTTIRWNSGEQNGQAIVSVSLACSLVVDPARQLFFTKRIRDFSDHIQPNHTRIRACGRPNCPMRIVSDFFKNNRCPNEGCSTTPADVLRKQEQKLVDTMLTADLIHLVKSSNYDIAVVSSDDDLWPGLQTALHYGARVIQVHTASDRQTPNQYTSGFKQYKFTTL